jgi:hypothetical protein
VCSKFSPTVSKHRQHQHSEHPTPHQQYETAVVISKVLLPQSNNTAAFVHSHSNITAAFVHNHSRYFFGVPSVLPKFNKYHVQN